jgi:hypothetical protein
MLFGANNTATLGPIAGRLAVPGAGAVDNPAEPFLTSGARRIAAKGIIRLNGSLHQAGLPVLGKIPLTQ